MIRILSYLLVASGAIIATSWYTSDLEMLWLAAFLLVPAWALVFGFIIGLIQKWITRSDLKSVAWVVLFSFIFHTGLMIEEIGVGVIRHVFDSRAKALNELERSSKRHEVDLGEGKSLYFKDHKDAYFELSFEFEGNNTISRDRIFDLAKQWLISKGYDAPEEGELNAYTKYYRKGTSFNLENPGQVLLSFDLADGPQKSQGKLKQIMIALKYKSGIFTFEERAWTYI